MKKQDVIIIGAPRSGTNMLRDILASFQAIGTWPCDEINYIWRHGNIRYRSDEFPAELARPRVIKYIQDKFEAIRKLQGVDFVVEKTCANCLRIPFVDRVVPEAKYIYIHRDGLDSAGSARLRWTAKLDPSYILQKARFVPVTDLPYYSLRYLWSRFFRLFSNEKRLAFWGPALKDMDEILKQHPLEEVCALQWQRCVEKAEAAFSGMPNDRFIRVCYEDFVRRPKTEMARILSFLGIEIGDEQVTKAVSGVSSKSIGKGRSSLSPVEINNLERLVGSSLDRYGYRNLA
jgi:hypothetical protein